MRGRRGKTRGLGAKTGRKRGARQRKGSGVGRMSVVCDVVRVVAWRVGVVGIG